MSVAFGAAGTLNSSVPTCPTVAAGDLMLLVVGMKPTTANTGTISTPSGWTSLFTPFFAGGYGSTLGTNTGNTLLGLFYKIAAGTEGGTTVPVTMTGVGVSECQIFSFTHSNSALTWVLGETTGEEDIQETPSVYACTSDAGFTSGDFAFGVALMAAQVAGGFSAFSFGIAGATQGTAVQETTWHSSTGNFIGAWIGYVPITAGTSNGTANTLSVTLALSATDGRGPGTILRLREGAGGMASDTACVSTITAALTTTSRTQIVGEFMPDIVPACIFDYNFGTSTFQDGEISLYDPEFVGVYTAPSNTDLGSSAMADVVSVTAALSTSIPLTASETVQATVQATLTTAIRPAATLAATSTITATLTTQISPVAALADLASTSASLTTAIAPTASLAALASLSATLTTAIRPTAAITCTASLTASLSTQITATAALSDVVALTSALTTAIPLTASMAAVVTLTGSMPNLISPIALTDAVSLTAALTTAIPVASALADASAVTAALTTAITPTAALADATSLNASLTTAITLTSSLAAASTVTASLTTQIVLTAALAASSTLTPGLTAGSGLSASLAATSSTSGTLTTAIRATAALASSASISATLSTTISATAALSDAAAVTSTLSTAIRPAASIAANCSVSGTLTTHITMAAALADQVTISAGLSSLLINASIAAQCTLAASLTTVIGCTAAIAATCTVSASLTTAISPVASVAAQSTVSGNLTTKIRVAAALTNSVSVNGSLGFTVNLAVNLAAQCSLTPDLTTVKSLDSDLVAQASASADLHTKIALQAALQAQAFIQNLKLETSGSVSGSMFGSAQCHAELLTGISMVASLNDLSYMLPQVLSVPHRVLVFKNGLITEESDSESGTNVPVVFDNGHLLVGIDGPKLFFRNKNILVAGDTDDLKGYSPLATLFELM